MNPNNDIEMEENYIDDNYVDMEAVLEKQEFSEKAVKSVRNLSDLYTSQEQLSNKGKLLGHYKSTGFLKTYIDIYERAVIGKAENNNSKKAEDIRWGYARLAKAIVDGGVLCLVMNDEKIYKLRHLKMAEMVAYMINGQKLKTMNEEPNERGK